MDTALATVHGLNDCACLKLLSRSAWLGLSVQNLTTVSAVQVSRNRNVSKRLNVVSSAYPSLPKRKSMRTQANAYRKHQHKHMCREHKCKRKCKCKSKPSLSLAGRDKR